MRSVLEHVLSMAPAPGSPALSIKSLPEVIGNLTAWIIGILAGVATLFLTIGGLRYLAAGGDPAEVERAKGSLRSAMLGYALALLAPVLLDIVRGIVGA
ncbi:pilin [Catellatospora sichuanensis]|uniref:pilin n=1 Tax=Catellatospora sichuanensis TaxID=1969805 RepID=UPI001FEC1DEB|nr:pilin [Catellatospora sichuanensis]